MREWSVFIDESGDFGEYNPVSPYCTLVLLFIRRRNDISGQIVCSCRAWRIQNCNAILRMLVHSLKRKRI